MATYLVTGGCGFIGSHLVEALLEQQHKVRVLDNLTSGKVSNLPKGVDVINSDITDVEAVKEAFVGVDGCFHLAAIASVQQCLSDWVGTHRVNQSATINIFNAAYHANQKQPVPVVYTSSAAVYGMNSNVPLAETFITQPITSYGVDKLGCELHAGIARQIYNVPTIGLRLFNVYGPKQDPHSPYSGVISIFFNKILEGDEVVIYGDGNQTRDFIYVKDVARCFIQAMQHPNKHNQIYNVCTGKSVSINELALNICKVLKRKVPIKYQSKKSGDIYISQGDPTLASAELGFQASIPIEVGLEGMIGNH